MLYEWWIITHRIYAFNTRECRCISSKLDIETISETHQILTSLRDINVQSRVISFAQLSTAK